MDQTLNIVFFVFHTVWILFNCLGWIWRRTRRLHLATVTLTALSWFVLGARYGWGYCPCTDWHWRVRERLGYQDPPSYVQLLIHQLIGIDLGPGWSDALALVTLMAVALLSGIMNISDRRRTTTQEAAKSHAFRG
jgi:hypothetical protein